MAGRHRKPSHRESAGRHRRPPARSPFTVPALAVVALAAAGGGAAWGLSQGGGSAATGAVASVHATQWDPLAVLTSTPTSGASTRPSTTRAAAHARAQTHARRHHAAPDALRVRITGTASYLEVRTRDGRLLTERILHHGQHAAFRHHGLHVVLGDAGAVRMSIDGHRGHVAGHSGQVRRFTVR